MPITPEQIADRLEIEDVLARYCYAIDDRNWNAYSEIFTPAAVIDDTVTGGVKSGVKEHVDYLKRALSRVLISQHAISTVTIRFNGDEANVRAHCSCPMVLDIGGGKSHVFFQGLWYRNTFVRGTTGWKIHRLSEEGYWIYNAPPGFKF